MHSGFIRQGSRSFTGVLPFILVALVVTTGSPLAAQEAPVEPGARVRVKAPPQQPDWLVGTVSGLSSDSLVLKTEGGERRFLWTDLEWVQIHQGKQNHVVAGAALGTVGGLLLGLLLNAALEDCPAETPQFPRDIGLFCAEEGERGKIYAYTALLGAGVGTLLGLLWRTERWEDIGVRQLEPVVTLWRQPDRSLAIMAGLRD